jgi:hypothetical protein
VTTPQVFGRLKVTKRFVILSGKNSENSEDEMTAKKVCHFERKREIFYALHADFAGGNVAFRRFFASLKR